MKRKDKNLQFCSSVGSAGTLQGTQCQRTFLCKSTNLGDCNVEPVLILFLFSSVVNGSYLCIHSKVLFSVVAYITSCRPSFHLSSSPFPIGLWQKNVLKIISWQYFFLPVTAKRRYKFINLRFVLIILLFL